MNDLDRMLSQRLTEVRDAHMSELGSELHARRADLFRRVRRRRTIRGAGAFAVATAVVVGGLLVVPGIVERRTGPPAGDDAAVRVQTIEGVPGNSLVAAHGDSAVVVSKNGAMLGIDASDELSPSTTIETSGCCDDLAWGEAGLWLSTSSDEGVVLERLAPESGGVIDRVPLPELSGPYRLEVGERIWAFQHRARHFIGVRRKDLVPEFIEAIPGWAGGYTPAALVEDGDDGSVWVLYNDDATATRAVLVRIAPTRIGPTGVDEEIARPEGCPSGATDAGEMTWLMDPCLSRLYGYSSSGREVGTELPAEPGAIASGLGFVWVAYPAESYVTRHDPLSGEQIGEPVDVGAEPVDIAAGDDAVWVANRGDGTVSRITLGAVPPPPTEPSTRERVGIYPGPFDQGAAQVCRNRGLDSPGATAAAFTGDMLGWSDPEVRPTDPGQPGGAIVSVVGPEAELSVVLEAIPGAPDCWWVTDVGSASGQEPGVSVDVQGRYTTVGFEPLGADRVRVVLAYPSVGGDQEISATEGSVRFDLMSNPQEQGIVLVVWKDSGGVAFEAVGIQIPAGDFSTSAAG